MNESVASPDRLPSPIDAIAYSVYIGVTPLASAESDRMFTNVAARVPVGPAALPGQADHVRVVQVQRHAQRVRAVLAVIVVEVVAHPDRGSAACVPACAPRRPRARCRCRRRRRRRPVPPLPVAAAACRPSRRRCHRRPRPRSRQRTVATARGAPGCAIGEQARWTARPKFRRPRRVFWQYAGHVTSDRWGLRPSLWWSRIGGGARAQAHAGHAEARATVRRRRRESLGHLGQAHVARRRASAPGGVI